MDEINDLNDALWEDFLILGEEYKTKMCSQHFATRLLTYTFRLCYDCAPSREDVKDLTQECMRIAYEWHLESKTENEENNE